MSQPGIIFGINDSGHDALVFAFDSTGTHRGIWRLAGARNEDWEAAALGPCSDRGDAPTCLYVADVGDNSGQKSYVTIYKLPEPIVEGVREVIVPVSPTGRLRLRYPDRPHDVEAIFVTGDGAVHLITKRRLLDETRRPRPALIHRVVASAWDSSGIVTAPLVDSLPIYPGSGQGRLITDAALSPDGKRLAVRTYGEVFVFTMDSTSRLPSHQVPPASCFVAGLEERQGEGIGWWWDSRRLLLTSEGHREPLHVITCGSPPG